MDHVAIMKKSWGLVPKILGGEKRVESRWYKTKYPPWNRIEKGDTIYFKDSGKPVSVKARVTKVLQYDNLTGEKRNNILEKYGEADLGTREIMGEVKDYVENKKYCILVFFNNAEKIIPFNIDKTGYGAMASWLVVDDISEIKIG